MNNKAVCGPIDSALMFVSPFAVRPKSRTEDASWRYSAMDPRR